MCLLCTEVIKEQIKPKDFWRNYREISEDHRQDVIAVVANTSYEYQMKLAGYEDKGNKKEVQDDSTNSDSVSS